MQALQTRSDVFGANAALVRTFVTAFNRRDPDDFLAVTTDDVELHIPRGVLSGRRQAVEWLRKPFDELERYVEIRELLVGEDQVLATASIVFTWRETGDEAQRMDGAAVWRIRGGAISSWQPFTSEAEALGAAGFDVG